MEDERLSGMVSKDEKIELKDNSVSRRWGIMSSVGGNFQTFLFQERNV